jgi:D-glycero-alpha-D-manno-heptose 1-phosphate guanylyltransferase
MILAGGFGTRLRTVLPDLPKCMAPVNGYPFLECMLHFLWQQGIQHIVLSLGYRHQVIMDYVKSHHPDKQIDFVVETEPLGTGGAIAFALQKISAPEVFVLNGDTFFNGKLAKLEAFHHQHQSHCSLMLKPMEDAARYGTVVIGQDHRITGFEEKKPGARGLINGGIYLLNKAGFEQVIVSKKFSFETEYLAANLQNSRFYGQVQDEYFIDIGIPASYEKAQQEWAVFFPPIRK